MAIGQKRSLKVLDDERCFMLYAETGSVYKVARLLASEGLVNERTGRPYTPMGIWTAAWRYGIASPEKGKKIVQQVARSKGVIFSPTELDDIINTKAKYIYARKKNGYELWKHSIS